MLISSGLVISRVAYVSFLATTSIVITMTVSFVILACWEQFDVLFVAIVGILPI